MAENKANIPLDDFVSKVVKDPKQPPDTILLTGYLGKSSEEGHARLYFDPELKSYVEIPNDAILHTQEIPKEHSSLGGSHVWIKSDAELIHGKVGPSRTKAKFFEGPIAAAAGAAGGGAGAQLGPSVVALCPTPHVGGCTQPPTPGIICGITHPCVTSPVSVVYCPPTPFCPHTIPAICFPHFTPGCPVATANVCPSVGGCPSIACGVLGGPVEQQAVAAHAVTAACHLPSIAVACASLPALCPHTPLHGCPPPVTPLCTVAVQCHTLPPVHCPSAAVICPQTIHPPCIPHLTQNLPYCPVVSANACPSFGACPSIACGFQGGGGDPLAAHAAMPHLPTAPGVLCPSHAAPCPTSPVFCHTQPPACPLHTPLHGCPPPPTPLCQSVHVPCISVNQVACHPTNPIICHATSPLICHPLTPTCPSIHVCQSIPLCPSAGACPSIACGGNPGGGINQ